MRNSNWILVIIAMLFISHMLAKESASIIMYHTEFYIMVSAWFIVNQLEKFSPPKQKDNT